MRCPPARHANFNWELLGIQHHDLTALDEPFTEQEIKNAIDHMPGDKVPGQMASLAPSSKPAGTSSSRILWMLQTLFTLSDLLVYS